MTESMNNVSLCLNVNEKQLLITLLPNPPKKKWKKEEKQTNIEIVVKFHMNSQVTTD